MKSVISNSLQETENIAQRWIEKISEKNIFAGKTSNETIVVGLSGHLGSGKTAFAQAAAKALRINEIVTSPTFVIMKFYETDHLRFKKLVHIDAYRLENGKELQALDFEKIVSDPVNLVLIEWPENVKEVLLDLENYRVINFEVAGEQSRKITFE